MRRVVRSSVLVAVASLGVAAPAEAATQLTVTKKTTVPTTQRFSFTLTGPGKCGDGSPTPTQTFTLGSGESTVVLTCDTPDPPTPQNRFQITENATPGWQLTDLTCTSKDTDPTDAFIIKPPTAFVEFSVGERKACTFTDAPVSQGGPPPTPVPGPTPPPTPTPAPVPTPNSAPQFTPKPKHRCAHGRRHIVIKHGPNKGKHVTVCKRPRPVSQPNFTG